ncbi:MAG: serine/threonine protein kinase [Planctomycetaceae bacterium]|nr:serine/threonine protein kinase [Planctomycetaceae bacterium]
MPDDVLSDEIAAQPIGLPRHEASEPSRARDSVEVLASQFVDEHRQGLSPTVDDYARRYPQHAVDIRRLFPLVAAMEDWKCDKSAAARPLPSTIDVDRLGDCRILHEIGRGGMGVVFEGYQDPPGRRVAVKILPWQHSPDSPWREQFAHEARLAARLRHANIVPVYQYGEQAGFSYYVMPFIVGVGLDWIIERLSERDGVVYAEEIRRAHARQYEHEIPSAGGARRSSPLSTRPPVANGAPQSGLSERRQLTARSWRKFAKIGVQAAAALRHAHRKGLLHRDIKPANVLLDADGVVWITDFGLARHISSVEEPADVAGTLRYMSPEHLAGSADERSDVYALGITLYELCTLRPAFPAKTRTGLKQAICRGEIVTPRAVQSQIPPSLEAIILKAAAADPAQRYQTADELKCDLLRFLNGGRVLAATRRWFSA